MPKAFKKYGATIKMIKSGIKKVLLASESKIKLEAVSTIFGIPKEDIVCRGTQGCELPEQPVQPAGPEEGRFRAEKQVNYVGSDVGLFCAEKRLNYVAQKYPDDVRDCEIIVVIENFVRERGEKFTESPTDVCGVYIIDAEGYRYHLSQEIPFPKEFFYEAKERSAYKERGGIGGFSVTVGEVMAAEDPSINSKDWMSSYRYRLAGGIYRNRLEQIWSAMPKPYRGLEYARRIVTGALSLVPDFPRPGILFKDLSPVISSPYLFSQLIKLSMSRLSFDFDNIAALDSRGFIYGSALANRVKSGVIMVRKKGKLPCTSPDEKLRVDYETEYSSDTVEILKSSVRKGEKVLIVDDLVATGGSLAAAKGLIEGAGARVVGCLVILAVEPLLDGARKAVGEEVPLIVVL